MRRFRFLGATMVAAALVATACGDSDDDGTVTGGQSTDTTLARPTFAAGTTMATLQSKGKIVVGVKFDQPGLGQKNPISQKVEGFDVEIAKQIAVGIFGGTINDIESKIDFREATTPNREVFIENGTVDMVVATYTINDARKQRIDFAGPYYIAGQSILVKNDNTDITGPDSFKDGTKKVCSVTNSTPATNIEKYLGDKAKQLVLFDIYQKCVDALKGGQVNAVTTDNVILTGFVATNEGQFKLAGTPFTEEPYGIGLKKGDKDFREFVNKTLETSFTDGTYLKAWKDTAGKFDPADPKIPTINRY